MRYPYSFSQWREKTVSFHTLLEKRANIFELDRMSLPVRSGGPCWTKINISISSESFPAKPCFLFPSNRGWLCHCRSRAISSSLSTLYNRLSRIFSFVAFESQEEELRLYSLAFKILWIGTVWTTERRIICSQSVMFITLLFSSYGFGGFGTEYWTRIRLS